MVSVAIIGGGASGLAAGIWAAREGAAVTIYEGKDRPGKKLLATGNGKCNLSNVQMSPDFYFGGSKEWIKECLYKFSVEDTIRFFEGLGLYVKEKNGYLYPMCSQATVVLEVMREELRELGVRIVTGHKVLSVRQMQTINQYEPQSIRPYEFELCIWDESQQKQLYARYDKVILACGGKVAPKTGSDGSGYALAESLGHRITPVFPALTPLYCKDSICKQLAGVRAEGKICIWDQEECIAQETGEIQFTEYGLSGIPIFQVSRIVNSLLQENARAKSGAELLCTVDFMEQLEPGQEEEILTKRLLFLGDRSVEAFFTGLLHQKLVKVMCRMAGLEPSAQVKNQDRQKLLKVLQYCRSLPFHIVGSGTFEQAQVTAGGVDVSQVNTDMESKLVPGLYFAGEILDVDGACGGYNLQWAWTSGYLAGIHAAR
jgi:predicted Rossmann fold flavoprotein